MELHIVKVEETLLGEVTMHLGSSSSVQDGTSYRVLTIQNPEAMPITVLEDLLEAHVKHGRANHMAEPATPPPLPSKDQTGQVSFSLDA